MKIKECKHWKYVDILFLKCKNIKEKYFHLKQKNGIKHIYSQKEIDKILDFCVFEVWNIERSISKNIELDR